MEISEKKKKPIGIIIAILVVVFLAALAVFRILNTKNRMEMKPLSTVSVTKSETGDISIETSLVGTVEPGDVYYVTPKAAGEITKIYVKVGDSVKAGDPICDLDCSKSLESAKITLDGAQVSLKTAEDGVELAKKNLDRMTALLASGDISQQTYESTKNAYDQATAGLDGAKLSLEGAQLQYDTTLEYSTVTAPVDGVVESVSMSLNGMASQASQVAVISSDGASKVTFSITDRLLQELKVGDPISVRKQGSTYEGKITKIETMPSNTTGLYPVEAFCSEADSIPKGSNVKIFFNSEKAEGVTLVDTDAVYYDGGKTFVYTISYNDENQAAEGSTIMDGNKAATVHKVEVETGLSDTDKTEIVSGIDADSIIVKTWTSQLYEGAQVQVLPMGD